MTLFPGRQLKLIAFIFLVLFLFSGKIQAADITIPLDGTNYTFTSDGAIYSVAEIENIVYISGDFNRIALVDQPLLTRHNIASYDVQTKSFTNWSPVVNDTVRTVAANYTEVYIAGEFTQINGHDRQYIASFNRTTNNLTDWSLPLNGVVNALALDGPDLYIGGTFTSINNQQQRYLTIYDTEIKELVPWFPQINSPVHAVMVDNLTVYITGEFTVVNGQPRKYVAAFDKSTGNLTSWMPAVNEPIGRVFVQDSKIYLFAQPEFGNKYIATVDLTSPTSSTTVTTPTVMPQGGSAPTSAVGEPAVQGIQVDASALGFQVPNLSEVLTFILRSFFVIGGMVALFYLLLGAFSWITSGGDKDAVSAARNKIQSAIVGLLMMVAVLAIVVTLEQIVFRKRICFGLSCPASIPSLIEPI